MPESAQVRGSVRKRQCKACPWRKDVVPDRDIPGEYTVERHLALRSTIASDAPTVGELIGTLTRPMRVMACHESSPGREQYCVGWVVNQLGDGNNIALRLQARDGRFEGLRTVGPQHQRFEDTLPGAAGEEDGDGEDQA